MSREKSEIVWDFTKETKNQWMFFLFYQFFFLFFFLYILTLERSMLMLGSTCAGVTIFFGVIYLKFEFPNEWRVKKKKKKKKCIRGGNEIVSRVLSRLEFKCDGPKSEENEQSLRFTRIYNHTMAHIEKLRMLILRIYLSQFLF